jgi:membrane protein implicated in regulation of membrane protease activity
MIDYINSNMGTTWFIFGCALLALEAFVFGMSTAALLFAGFAALLTGGLLWFGILPATWTASFAVFTVATVAFVALLWKPFKKLQSAPFQKNDDSSDFIGYEFTAQSDIAGNAPSSVRYSGIEWRVELDTDSSDRTIAAGESVKVSSISAGVFKVVPVDH